MWWHGGAGLTERSERGSLSAVATHDVFADWIIDWAPTIADIWYNQEKMRSAVATAIIMV
jgi:hypothetical protein